MINWVKNNTGILKITCAVPKTSRHVIQFVQDIGYNLEGVSPKSFLKNDKLIDRILFGLEL